MKSSTIQMIADVVLKFPNLLEDPDDLRNLDIEWRLLRNIVSNCVKEFQQLIKEITTSAIINKFTKYLLFTLYSTLNRKSGEDVWQT